MALVSTSGNSCSYTADLSAALIAVYIVGRSGTLALLINESTC